MKGTGIQDLLRLFKGHLLRKGENAPAETPLLDSRIENIPFGAVFFAIKGKNHNGHAFIAELASKGLKTAVVSEDPELPENLQINLIRVNNTLNALQRWAAFHRSAFEAPVIGITGSNGKTIVKEWLYQLLREDLSIVRSPKSYNSQIGVPLSVLLIEEEHELAIFEAGISHPGEMEKLGNIILPDIGILTNIGHAHSENFASRKEQIQEKIKLFEFSEKIIYCSDDAEAEELIREKYSGKELIGWGSGKNAWLKQLALVPSASQCKIELEYPGGRFEIEIPFTDEASVKNAVCCCAVMLCMGYQPDTLIRRFYSLTPIEMRLEILNGINNCTLINDSYNSDIRSLEIALDFMNQHRRGQQRTVVLSDILQDKQNDTELYKQIGLLLSEKGVDRLIAIGEKISKCDAYFKGKKSYYRTTAEYLSAIQSSEFRDEIILIKGARSYGFERISKRLQQKAHETVLEINLNALAHNFSYYRNKLLPGTKMMAMVKAFSYGSGGAEIASLLEFNRCDYLAVAYPDEGIDLRRAGIRLPIMVMNPVAGSFGQMLRFRLEPEIYSFKILQDLIHELRHEKQQAIPVHLKIDTGMHRLGFEPDEIPRLTELLSENPRIEIASVFSHLAASDVPELDAFSLQQMHLLEQAYQQICRKLTYKPMKHILNSAGISRFPDAQLDMVRLGVGLYGIGVSTEDQQRLENVSTLKTIISQIKKIQPGETVGYSRKGIVNKETLIATIPIGYADGFSRQLGNGRGEVIIRGHRAPVIGNVCMDMTMINISSIPDVQEGDEVIVFGKDLSVTEIASKLNTIAYEILTSVSARVKRVYLRE